MGKILHRLHRKGPVATKLTRLNYHVWGAMLQAFHKLQSKSKTILELNSTLQQVWDDLTQMRSTKLSTTFANV